MVMRSGDLAYEPKPFPFPGAVDADGHVAEPANLWEEYLESRYRHRAIRIRKDAQGLEYLESDLRVIPVTMGGILPFFIGVGETDFHPGPERTWSGSMPYGAGDPQQRVDLMNRENMEIALLYPTLSLCWEYMTPDPEISLAFVRAYNRWIADFCRGSKGRLVPIAQLTLLDPEGSAKELERAVEDGCKGAFVTMGTPIRKPHAHPDHDVVFAKAEALGVPFAMHPNFQPGEYLMPRYGLDMWAPENTFYADTLFFQMLQQAFVGFFHYGVFEKFPRLKIGVLESGSGWIGSLLDRMDALFDAPTRFRPPLKDKPSFYFRRQCFISGDPDEPSAAPIMQHVGPECFLWASDYPHPDHTHTWVSELSEMAGRLDAKTRDLLLGRNVKRIYALG